MVFGRRNASRRHVRRVCRRLLRVSTSQFLLPEKPRDRSPRGEWRTGLGWKSMKGLLEPRCWHAPSWSLSFRQFEKTTGGTLCWQQTPRNEWGFFEYRIPENGRRCSSRRGDTWNSTGWFIGGNDTAFRRGIVRVFTSSGIMWLELRSLWELNCAERKACEGSCCTYFGTVLRQPRGVICIFVYGTQ